MHTFSTTTPITTGLFFGFVYTWWNPTHSAKTTRDHRGFKYIGLFLITFYFFQQQISKVRCIIENAVSILAHRWQILLTTVQQDPITIAIIVEICVNLHSFLRLSCNLKRWHWQRKCQPPIYSGSWQAFAFMHNAEWTTVTTSRSNSGRFSCKETAGVFEVVLQLNCWFCSLTGFYYDTNTLVIINNLFFVYDYKGCFCYLVFWKVL